jgi:hypothetical protein
MRWRAVIFGLAVVGLAHFVAGPRASADFFTNPQNFTIPMTQTNWGPGTPSLAGIVPLAVQQFDPATYSTGGKTAVLEGVEVKVDYEFENTLSMQFYNMSTITVTATGSMSISNPAGVAFLTSTPFVNTETLTANPSTVLGKTVTFPTKTYPGTMGSPAGGYTGAQTLMNFTGTGTISLQASANATSHFSTSSGNGFGSSLTLAGASVSIIYRYALVPEPSSLVLAGLGCVGLLGVCRQRLRPRGLKAA